MSANIANVYRSIIEDCITNLVPDFENAGVSTKILTQLQHVRILPPIL